MRIIVCGDREWIHRRRLYAYLDEIHDVYVLIHGDCRGADRMGRDWARARGIPEDAYPAKWSTHEPGWCPGEWCQHRRYCVAAGPRRNQQMLDEARPDRVIAFHDNIAKSKGTRDMLSRTAAAGVPHELVTAHAGAMF